MTKYTFAMCTLFQTWISQLYIGQTAVSGAPKPDIRRPQVLFHGLVIDLVVDIQVHPVLSVVIQPRCRDFRVSFGGISVEMSKYLVKSQIQGLNVFF